MVVGVVNYGMGNIHSVLRKLKLVGVNYKLIESPDHFENVDKIILPGVGHFGQAALVAEIKEAGKNNEYDCLVGVSGGIDSSYVAYLVKKLGLPGILIMAGIQTKPLKT